MAENHIYATKGKIIFWTSITLISFLVIVPFLAQFTPLEFTDDKLRNPIEQFRFLGLPVIILLTLLGTLKSRDRPETTIAKALFFCLDAKEKTFGISS